MFHSQCPTRLRLHSCLIRDFSHRAAGAGRTRLSWKFTRRAREKHGKRWEKAPGSSPFEEGDPIPAWQAGTQLFTSVRVFPQRINTSAHSALFLVCLFFFPPLPSDCEKAMRWEADGPRCARARALNTTSFQTANTSERN